VYFINVESAVTIQFRIKTLSRRRRQSRYALPRWSLVKSQIKNQKSKIKNLQSKIKNQKSKIKNRLTEADPICVTTLELGKISNQKSKIKNQKSKISNLQSKI